MPIPDPAKIPTKPFDTVIQFWEQGEECRFGNYATTESYLFSHDECIAIIVRSWWVKSTRLYVVQNPSKALKICRPDIRYLRSYLAQFRLDKAPNFAWLSEFKWTQDFGKIMDKNEDRHWAGVEMPVSVRSIGL